MRDNGAIEGGAGGFSVDDLVIVLKKYDDSKIYVIAHADGVRACGGFAVFEISVFGHPTVVVWDITKNQAKFTARSIADPDFVSWFTGKSQVGNELFINKTITGLVADYYPQGTQASIWNAPPPGLMDVFHHADDDQTGDYDIQACLPIYYGWFSKYNTFPYSETCAVSIPSGLISRSGMRVEEFASFDSVAGSSIKRDKIHSPFGEMCEFNGYGIGAGWVFDERFIPMWFIHDYEPGQPAWTPNKVAAYSKFWYSKNFAGSYSKGMIANAFIVNFTPCTHTYGSDIWDFDASRQIYVHAQALSCGNSSIKDWAATGNNTDLADEILNAVQLGYTMGSLPANEIKTIDLSVKLI